MSLKKKPSQSAPKSKLDGKPYSDLMKKAGKMADTALKDYPVPEMSLEELRALVDQELGDVSLSALVRKDRESGW